MGSNKRVKNAYNGLKHVLFYEMSTQVQFLFFFIIIYFANIFKISKVEWLVLILTFTLVIALEMVNTLAQELCDLYSKEKSEHVKKIKDIAAGAVLLASLSLIVVLAVIFLPYLNL